jgi:hypothetical protein
MRHRIINNDPCSQCSKIKVFCKGLCQACYSKKLRNTPSGKIKMKLYNDTKGKEARKRWIESQPPKPPKEPKINSPKPDCECGAKSEIKGFCYKCYHKYYQRKRYNLNARIKKSDKIKLFNNKIFIEIVNHVKSGMSIREACKIVNIGSSSLYRQMSDIQKRELLVCKLIGFDNEVDY